MGAQHTKAPTVVCVYIVRDPFYGMSYDRGGHHIESSVPTVTFGCIGV